ncbi:hypothetical protein [Phenylobacterium sp. J367]|uniref:hypothetical protein n=1 Tax=Phenylobacterium sp. J367 TaxID=2898435 RepID=UPI002150BD3D|nr:hypothetical protein [Phenylobacterium sp. J367]MCR5878953.1 hypothetical protein [Phenylobacterium sp. J367]
MLSAWGIGEAEVAALRQAGLERPLGPEGLAAASTLLDQTEAEARQALADQGAEAGQVRRTLRLRYDGADAELPVETTDLAAAKAAFEQAHHRLFGFVEPDRTILIAAVEAEAVSIPPLQGRDRRREATSGWGSHAQDPASRPGPRPPHPGR